MRAHVKALKSLHSGAVLGADDSGGHGEHAIDPGGTHMPNASEVTTVEIVVVVLTSVLVHTAVVSGQPCVASDGGNSGEKDEQCPLWARSCMRRGVP